jgi:BASS family bile acid:Na+ symporter
MASIPVFSPLTNIKLINLRQPLITSKPFLISRSSFSLQRVSKGVSISSLSCSSSSFHRRVGVNNRQGKSSLLKFGVDEIESVVVVGNSERDWSQILSALLPFVVAVTAVAALSQPSTFTWWGLVS